MLQGFERWEEIEMFKEVLTKEPETVDEEMLRKMFHTIIYLKEKTFDQLSDLQASEIPVTPIIQQARDDLPDVLSKEYTIVSFSENEAVTAMKQDVPGTKYYRSVSKISLENANSIDSTCFQTSDSTGTNTIRSKILRTSNLDPIEETSEDSKKFKKTTKDDRILSSTEMKEEDGNTVSQDANQIQEAEIERTEQEDSSGNKDDEQSVKDANDEAKE